MTAFPPKRPARSAAEVLRASPHHEAFLRLTERTRDPDAGRALLAAEWRYLGPLLEGRPHPRVLDMACGTGAQALAWAERGARAVGIDFDRALLALGRAHAADADHVARRAAAGGSAPEWACGDATRLPFPDGRFDVVFCNSLLEHVPDWRAVLAEIGRVLGSGGVAAVYTTNRHCPLQQEVNHFPFYSWLPDRVKRPLMRWIMEHRRDLVNYTDLPAVNWFTFPAMRRAFEAVGLEPRDRIDLSGAGGRNGRRSTFARLIRAFPALKQVYYEGAISMGLYGVKSRGGVSGGQGTPPGR
jgi:ubiquinone/menaquinone biosynthesis C-methylase UbiE